MIKEFDAVYYANSIRNLNTLVMSMLDDSEKFMAAYQSWNTISLKKGNKKFSSHFPTNDLGNSEDEEFKDMRKLVPKLYESLNVKFKHRILIDKFMVESWKYL